MDKKNFEGLLKGIRQAGKIMRGEMQPSRTFKFYIDQNGRVLRKVIKRAQ